MAILYGKNYSKKELLDKMGNIGTIAGIRQIEYQDGFARGLRAYEVVNGSIRFTAYIDKCLDIGEFYYNGVPMHYHARPGVMNGSWFYDGENAPRSIMCGMLFTCGLSNVGPLQEMPGGKTQPQHGFIRNTPAEHCGARTYWVGDDYYLELTGTMRESSLFGTNLVLRRTVRSVFGSGRIDIIDEVENQTAEEADLMLMYHCNFGYPFLRPGTRLVLPSKAVRGREEWSQEHLNCWQTMGLPTDGETEYVYLHDLAEDEQGNSFAALVSDDLHFGIRLDFDRKVQPYFMEWMSVRSGDYVIGLEPSNSSVYGRKYHEAQGTMHRIGPFAKETYRLSFTILQDTDAIRQAEVDCQRLLGK